MSRLGRTAKMNKDTYYLNEAQARVILIDPKIFVIIAGRRLGKSSEIIAHPLSNRVFDMPGSSWLLLGRTYKQILERTLPATKTGWAKRGYYEDTHYVIGKKPPKNWPRPKIEPSDWGHTIAWITGTVMPIGSQDREGLVNSLTCHGLAADEAKLLNQKRFQEDALPVVSAPISQFPDSPHNRSIMLCSSMPSLPDGQWLLDYAKLMDKEQIDIILALAVKIELEKEKFHACENRQVKANLAVKIRRMQEQLRLLRMNSVYYGEASTLANLPILGWDYIEQQQAILGDKFKQEILNLRPRTDSAFYAKMTDRHWISMADYSAIDTLGFSGSKDFTCLCDRYDRDAPLLIGMDFGANINCIVTAQRSREINMIRFIAEHWLKFPYIQDDVAVKWCRYYEPHKCKKVTFYYDNTGNNRPGNARITRADQVKKILESHGWEVIKGTEGGANVLHDHKHRLINSALDEKTPSLPSLRFNEANLECTRESMMYARAIESKNVIKKDKSSERKPIPQEYATHLSDALDTILIGELSRDYDSKKELYEIFAFLNS